jgi:hypothetical protein
LSAKFNGDRNMAQMSKFNKIKRMIAEDWAWEDVNDYDAREFVTDVVADYYEDSLPNTREELKEYLVEQKLYDEEYAEQFIKDFEEN